MYMGMCLSRRKLSWFVTVYNSVCVCISQSKIVTSRACCVLLSVARTCRKIFLLRKIYANVKAEGIRLSDAQKQAHMVIVARVFDMRQVKSISFHYSLQSYNISSH